MPLSLRPSCMSFMSLGKATISIRITQLMSNLLLVAERCGLAKSYPSPHVIGPYKGANSCSQQGLLRGPQCWLTVY